MMERWIWQKHEKEVNELLDLDGTIGSGNQSRDPGDGVHREHYTERKFPLFADAKCTQSKSYSVNFDEIRGYIKRASEYGKIFVLPMRQHRDDTIIDLALLRLDDFASICREAELEKVEVQPEVTQEQRDAADHLHWLASKISDPALRLKSYNAISTLLGEENG